MNLRISVSLLIAIVSGGLSAPLNSFAQTGAIEGRPVSQNLALPEVRTRINSTIQAFSIPATRKRLATEVNALGSLSADISKTRTGVPLNVPLLQGQLFQTKRALLDAARSAHTSSDKIRLREVSDAVSHTEKAFYTAAIRRNYPPETYMAIYNRTQFALAIARKSTSEIFCSAVLLAPDLVLTARHCVFGLDIADLEVWNHYAQSLDGGVSAPNRTDVQVLEVLSDDTNLDYAVVRITKAITPVYAFPCLSTQRVKLRDIIYVLGYPQQRPLTVHDFGEVLYPFEVTEGELEDILVSEEFRTSKENKSLESIKASYKKTSIAGDSYFRNMSSTWNGNPTIGVIVDTFHGNSGSAAFSRDNHRIIGIFVQGQPDYIDPWTPTWLRHEAVLPIKPIIEDLRAKQPELVAAVCIT